MDPNAQLEAMRELTANLIELNHGDQGYQLAEAVEALDIWLSEGGFLPEAWNR